MTKLADKRTTATNTGLAKVAVQCSADTFVVNQSLVLRINICGEIRFFAKPGTVSGKHLEIQFYRNNFEIN